MLPLVPPEAGRLTDNLLLQLDHERLEEPGPPVGGESPRPGDQHVRGAGAVPVRLQRGSRRRDHRRQRPGHGRYVDVPQCSETDCGGVPGGRPCEQGLLSLQLTFRNTRISSPATKSRSPWAPPRPAWTTWAPASSWASSATPTSGCRTSGR